MKEIIKLIDKYLRIGGKFLTSFFIGKKIGIPKSDFDWICAKIQQTGKLKDGTVYWKHGAGIDFKNKNWKISIDFGTNGEWNGFDSWRLFLFLQDNKIKSIFKDENEIQDLLNKGVKEGIFIEKEDLYFKK